MTLVSFLKPSTRRTILGSCLAVSLLASVPAQAANPPKFKDPEVTAFVQKFSDSLDSLGAAIKAKDEAKMEEVMKQMDALVSEYSGVTTKDGKLQPGKATPEENTAYQKWMSAEMAKSGLVQLEMQGRATKSLAMAKQLGLACKLYAGDNDGAFPPTLDALAPNYINAENFKKLLVSPFAPNEPVGYTYHPGLNDTSDPTTILLEDKFAPKASGQKIVVHVDGSGEVTK